MSERWRPLRVHDCDPDPFVQFHRWFDEAASEMPERDAVALVTATPEGRPSARMVLMRYIDDHSFGWFTNYESRKGREVRANPHAALLWYCEALGRQIRLEGVVSPLDSVESDAYFQRRARGSQLGAHASHQSEPLASREELEDQLREVSERFEGHSVARPEQWGGLRLTPSLFEFWQHRDDRLHDRVLYTRDGSDWQRRRLAP